MELKDFDKLRDMDFENGAVLDEIRKVFKERDQLRHYKDSTVGLLCTDRPDLLKISVKDMPPEFAKIVDEHFWELI